MTTGWIAPLAVWAAGCALAPEMHVDEERLVQRYSRAEGTSSGPGFSITPITARLVTAMARQPREGGPAPVEQANLAKELEGYVYRVAARDVLDITVWDHPELDSVERALPGLHDEKAEARGYLVHPDGTIFFPGVGMLPVAGKTPLEIRELLIARLVTYLENPQLDVRVSAFRGRRVYVTGEVSEPSVLPITDVPLTALQAIQMAKGLTRSADLSDVTLCRDGKRHRLDLEALYGRGDVPGDWLLQDGDVLNVPDRAQRRVFVLGEVKKPSAQPMLHRPMSLADAIADAEGVVPDTSDPGRIYVFREGEAGRPVIFRLDAEQPDAILLAAEFPLQPRDVVFVSTNALARWNRVVTQILPSVQALWQGAALPLTVRALAR